MSIHNRLFEIRQQLPNGKSPELTEKQVRGLIECTFVTSYTPDEVNDLTAKVYYVFEDQNAFMSLLLSTFFNIIEGNKVVDDIITHTIYIRSKALDKTLEDILGDDY